MDAPTTLSIVSTVIALASLGVSGFLTYRQTKLSRHANHSAALVQMYSEMRSPQFHDDYNFVVQHLRADCSPDCGIYELPEAAKRAVINVSYYYQNLANLMHFGVLDETEVLPMIRTRITNLWYAIQPFVEAERRRKLPIEPISMLQYLEKYAHAAGSLPMPTGRSRPESNNPSTS